ncbi:hypothetical protein [Parablautia sp. Marseille-Q6255]|nr:hypothetical protein [Parablautia sp. Marseille-Q6255]
MKRAAECIIRVLINILMMIAALITVMIIMPLWIVAEILDDE